MRLIPKARTRIKILTFKISVVLCSIAKATSECINWKENNDCIKSFKSIKVRSYIDFIHIRFIHSVMSENDKKVPLIIHDCHHPV